MGIVRDRYTSPVLSAASPPGVHVKKGRHRRFEEARAFKRTTKPEIEPCAECGAEPGHEHASWCLAEEDDDVETGSGDDD